MVTKVHKHWGHEEILHCGRYAMKTLHIKPGCSLSLQYHLKKIETLYVSQGEVKIYNTEKGNTFRLLKRGEYLHVPNGLIHRIANETDGDVIVVEASTPELDDVVRLKTYEK